jgi:acyl-coenzyme A thioesterase 13
MREAPEVPEGFLPSERSSPLLDLIGPLYVAEHDGAIIVGLRAEPRHANGRGAIHAAVLSALSDIALGRNAAATYNPPQHIVTVNLSIDFIAAANPGQWLEATATVQRAGKRLAFAQGRIHADGKLVAQTSATFATTPQ